MALTIAVVREQAEGERRCALVPEVAKKLKALGASLLAESGFGGAANMPDSLYADTEFVADRNAVLARADIVLHVQPLSVADIGHLREGAIVVGYLQPHLAPERVKALRDRRITSFSLELLPRTTRAQAMDVLSSQASMAGYKATLIAAELSGKFFPMLTTAAGTVRPAKVLIIGAGVAGLQAIATARRLGGSVEAFDVRPETKEQIESLGAKFLDLGVSAKGEGGYARELTAEERAEQSRRLGEQLKHYDVLITTAAVPGRPAPKIISAEQAKNLRPGAVVVDLAAETGGNCALTQPGHNVVIDGVTYAGPLNLASMGAIHASEMYARNQLNFLSLSVKGGACTLDWNDELIAKSALTHEGRIVHEATRKLVEGA
ncbi:MAG: NAD(P) transhydrogenase subunit alpha [Xanthomonadales bacterium]|nr:NAD(P) transhydrogenase subunit alpha part 1 [Xanthomonadales bacterium]MCC6593367.1 NAD(P) transhydrogenase subunit alpha [Xanthomonadales bacterium]MCE7930642.1 NAD(P) transhydrogenase subunit alpha [Xanthomonadales bacterium PRO6]